MTFVRSRSMRLTTIGATVALTAGLLAGTATVAQDESPAASDMALDGTGVDIEYIVKENINPFWVWQINSATAEAEKLGANLHACWGVQDPDPEGQTECIENAISRGANTIIIAPANAGVTPAIDQAREAGLMTIAVDTKTEPADAVDMTFATDNFQAGLLIGQWAAAKLGDAAADAKVAFINIDPSQPIVGVQRNQGFMQGFGMDVGDINMWGDETDPRIVGQEVGHGNQEGGLAAMELLLQANPDINVLYTINEPTAAGAMQALEAAGKTADDVLVLSVDGGCAGVTDLQNGIIDATSMQFPSRMAELSVDWAVRNAMTGEFPSPEDSPYYVEGNDIYNTGVELITNDPQEGVPSEDSTWGLENCWGSA
jgi:fructose transport system substrate-binding protein